VVQQFQGTATTYRDSAVGIQILEHLPATFSGHLFHPRRLSASCLCRLSLQFQAKITIEGFCKLQICDEYKTVIQVSRHLQTGQHKKVPFKSKKMETSGWEQAKVVPSHLKA